MDFFFVFFVLLFFVEQLFAATQADKDTLLLAQIIHRHGDRNPTKPWGPNDPNKESDWPQGWGQLTTKGMQELYYLGQTLKERYRGFLSDEYVNSEVYVHSSGVERALMSAQCNLAGLFPLKKDRQWEPGLPWQPIPIHSSPVYDDWVMRSNKVCKKKYKSLVDSYLESSQNVKDFIQKNLKLIVRATEAAGLYKEGDDLENLGNAWRLGGNLHIARRYNKTLLPWMTDSLIDALHHLRAEKHGIQSQATQEIKRLNGGPFLGKILLNFLQHANGTLEPEDHTPLDDSKLRMFLFSGHDTNLAALLGVLGLYDPPRMLGYGTALIFELHKTTKARSPNKTHDPKELNVKTFLMEGIAENDATVRQLTIPGCGDGGDKPDCRLSELTAMLNETVVWSREELMQICGGSKNAAGWKFAAFAVVAFYINMILQ